MADTGSTGSTPLHLPAGSTPLHLPAGSTARPPWTLHVTQDRAGWSWASLRVLALAAGESHAFSTGGEELVVLPLAGACRVSCGNEETSLDGRRDVLAGPSDFCYLPRHADAAISTDLGGRFAVSGATAGRDLPFRTRRVESVAVELRGAGGCSRRVVNYCMPGGFDADRLMVCEVVTPSGNWSSYPPHKHDEVRPGETELEEIYYFEVAAGPDGEGIAYQRVYGTGARPIDLLAEVRDGDVVLVPHGYHGPSMAPPGYDLYYLNVMAGPGDRAWLVTDDPVHAWVRTTWPAMPVDPRLTTAPR